MQHDPAPQWPEIPTPGTGGCLTVGPSPASAATKVLGIGFNYNLKSGTKPGGMSSPSQLTTGYWLIGNRADVVKRSQ